MNPSILDADCTFSATPKSLPFATQIATGVFTNGTLFMNQLKEYPLVSLCTYTATWPIRLNIMRAIIGVRRKGGYGASTNLGEEHAPRFESVRYHPNIHAKIYLGYSHNEKLRVAFVGSHNFVDSTLCDLMLRVDSKKQLLVLQDYFNRLWETAFPLHTSAT